MDERVVADLRAAFPATADDAEVVRYLHGRGLSATRSTIVFAAYRGVRLAEAKAAVAAFGEALAWEAEGRDDAGSRTVVLKVIKAAWGIRIALTARAVESSPVSLRWPEAAAGVRLGGTAGGRPLTAGEHGWLALGLARRAPELSGRVTIEVEDLRYSETDFQLDALPVVMDRWLAAEFGLPPLTVDISFDQPRNRYRIRPDGLALVTRDEARRAAEAFIDAEMRVRFPHEIVIVEEAVSDRGDAWIFPYNGRGYLERGDLAEIMAGNAPIAVDKATGVAAFAR